MAQAQVSDVCAAEIESVFPYPLNSELWVLYAPSDGRPYNMEIIFVHDLHTEGSEDAWRTTWTNKDGICWPREFLKTKYPTARILSVSYDACATVTQAKGRMDSLYVVAENLLNSFFFSDSKVGQTFNCPILFVGHGLGCFVIKTLMTRVAKMYIADYEERNKLLGNVGGFVFYSPFNNGVSWNLYELESGESSSLASYQEQHNPKLSRLNGSFTKLRDFMQKQRNSNALWKVLTICESHQTAPKMPSDARALQRKETYVREGTARPYCDKFIFGTGDHFNVCKHNSTKDSAFQGFETWLAEILKGNKYSSPNSIPGFYLVHDNRLETFLPRKLFMELFPNRLPFYTYESFIEAAMGFFPKGFGVDGSEDDQKREISALLAHIDHGTSGLLYKEERDPPSTYCQLSTEFPCHPGKSYHGRGPLQLCWNYNYIQCGEDIGDDSLLSCPEKLSENPVIAFKSAFWFWCKGQWAKPSCHSVMTGSWTPKPTDIEAKRLPGFGLTINIINGVECNKYSVQANSRVEKYLWFCKCFDVDPGENIQCSEQKPF
ncbi:hypothetical protein Mapa_005242 [Marchantia paleacea]|nr:hypothetical protein Mapa_005242 [Marchantia paleacea]